MAKTVQVDLKRILAVTDFCLEKLEEAMKEPDPERAMQKALLAKSIAETLQALRGLDKFPTEYSKLTVQAQPRGKLDVVRGEELEVAFGGDISDEVLKH